MNKHYASIEACKGIFYYCRECYDNGKYCAESGNQSHISGIPDQCATITPTRLPDFTTIPTPTCIWNSLPERSVQTTALITLEL